MLLGSNSDEQSFILIFLAYVLRVLSLEKTVSDFLLFCSLLSYSAEVFFVKLLLEYLQFIRRFIEKNLMGYLTINSNIRRNSLPCNYLVRYLFSDEIFSSTTVSIWLLHGVIISFFFRAPPSFLSAPTFFLPTRFLSLLSLES